MVRLNAILSGIFGLVMTGAPASATDYTELTLFFASSATINSGKIQPATQAPVLQDDALLSPEDVFELASAGPTDPLPGGLFKDADLIVTIHSVSNDITHAEVLSHCKSLDLVVNQGLFGQSANCDRETFSYGVDGNTIVILKNDKSFREYELKAGNYMINGAPVIFN